MKARALVAWNVRRIRVDRGIPQEQLAYDAGIDRSYMSGLERQSENPTIDLLDRNRRYAGCSFIRVVRSAAQRSSDAQAFAQRSQAGAPTSQEEIALLTRAVGHVSNIFCQMKNSVEIAQRPRQNGMMSPGQARI